MEQQTNSSSTKSFEYLDILEALALATIEEVIIELHRQVAYPPGKDTHIRNCYEALQMLLEVNSSVRLLLENVLNMRGITAKHFVSLFFRSVQYIELYHRQGAGYPAVLVRSEDWKNELAILVEDYGDLLTDLLSTRFTNTTLYQRYAGPKAVLSALYSRSPVTVVDLGCGANHGLPGIKGREPFHPIVDQTSRQLFANLLDLPLVLQGIAVDRENPYSSEFRQWLLACSLYPTELYRLPAFSDFCDRVATIDGIRFYQADLLALSSHLLTNEGLMDVDAVILSTVLYQYDIRERRILLALAKSMLKPHGILIIQDFAWIDPNDPQDLIFSKNWFGSPYPYRTFITGSSFGWNMQECFQWNSSRCLLVKEGNNLNQVL